MALQAKRAKALRPLTKADREAIRKHIAETNCPATNMKALLVAFEEIDRPIRQAVHERTLELQRRADQLREDNKTLLRRLADLKEPEEAQRTMEEVLYKIVGLGGRFQISSSVGDDGPRNEIEADLMKIAIDAQLVLRGLAGFKKKAAKEG
jgi:hypothetical protein